MLVNKHRSVVRGELLSGAPESFNHSKIDRMFLNESPLELS